MTKPNRILLLVVLLVCSVLQAVAQENVILLDEDFTDWSESQLVHTDPTDDVSSVRIDFHRLWVYNDDQHIYISFEIDKEIDLQDQNNLSLYLDLDNNSSTGFQFGDLGSELRYFFGFRFGLINAGNNSELLSHDDIQFIPSPTVNENRFEFSIKRNGTIKGLSYAFGSSVKMLLIDEIGGGDRLPDSGSQLVYNLNQENILFQTIPEIVKAHDSDIRIVSYNVLNDGPFDPARKSAINRVLRALKPDIIAFQEIYDHSSSQVLNEFQDVISTEQNESWYHAGVEPDIILLSKYPIIGSTPLSGNGAFLLDIGSNEILLIAAHLPCCDNDAERQLEVDHIMSFIRDNKSGNGSFLIDEETGIIICGDLNMVGDKRQLRTLLTGDIKNEEIYGQDFQPDWDNSNFMDSKPFTTGIPATITWTNDNSSFAPGRLDFMIYSSSNLFVQNKFILYTAKLSSELLSGFGLNPNDTETASDHLPVVTDFSFTPSTSIISENEFISMLKIFPNPTANLFKVSFELNKSKYLNINILDNNYKIVDKPISNGFFPLGSHLVKMQTDLNNGLYYLSVTDGLQVNLYPFIILSNP